MTGTVDEGFIRRTYRTSYILLAFGILISWALGDIWAACGWILGGGMSIATLRSFEWIVRRVFVPDPVNAKKELIKFAAIKLPVVLLIVGIVVKVGGHHFSFVAGFCVGIILTQSVMFMKVAGMLINQRFNR